MCRAGRRRGDLRRERHPLPAQGAHGGRIPQPGAPHPAGAPPLPAQGPHTGRGVDRTAPARIPQPPPCPAAHDVPFRPAPGRPRPRPRLRRCRTGSRNRRLEPGVRPLRTLVLARGRHRGVRRALHRRGPTTAGTPVCPGPAVRRNRRERCPPTEGHGLLIRARRASADMGGAERRPLSSVRGPRDVPVPGPSSRVGASGGCRACGKHGTHRTRHGGSRSGSGDRAGADRPGRFTALRHGPRYAAEPPGSLRAVRADDTMPCAVCTAARHADNPRLRLVGNRRGSRRREHHLRVHRRDRVRPRRRGCPAPLPRSGAPASMQNHHLPVRGCRPDRWGH